MKFNIYGRFVVEIRREGSEWRACKPGNGIRVPLPDLIIPANLREQDLITFLDDHYHEYAVPGGQIRRLDP